MKQIKTQKDIQAYIQNLHNLIAENKFHEAITLTQSGLKTAPRWVEGYALLGKLFWQTGQHQEAVNYFRQALAHQPDRPEWLLSVLNCELQLGDQEGAVPKILEFISVNSENIDLIIEGVSLLSSISRHDIASATLKWCLKKHPGNPVLTSALAAEIISNGQAAEGCNLFISLVSEAPETIQYAPIIASALGKIGDFENSLKISEAFLRSGYPVHPSFLSNTGCALLGLNRSAEAVKFYEKAYADTPENEECRFGLACAYLKSGDYEKGWRQHELRPSILKRPETHPWRGEQDLSGKTLLLLGDQGLGDCIQFVRYVQYLKDEKARLILAVPGPLVRLFSNISPDIEVRDIEEKNIPHDFSCPLLSLPFALMSRIGTTIPADIPYLFPCPDDVSKFAIRTEAPAAQKKKVGLVWSGAKRQQYGIFYQARSSTLAGFAPVLACSDAEFVNLQVGAERDELRNSEFSQSIIDPMGNVRDMADTAAIMQSLDLIIAVDTSAAHLAGALGKPVWMLTRSDCCWRWLEGRTDTPWYPTMRIFRSEPGSLDHAIRMAAEALPEFLKAGPALPGSISEKAHEALT